MDEENFDYLEWEKIDFKFLETKMTDTAGNSLDAVKALEDVVNGHGDFDYAFESTDAFMVCDFGPKGWFFNFVAVNENALAQFHPTTQEDIQKYAYWDDLKLLKSMCEKAYSGYEKLNKELFKACFDFLQTKANMEAVNLNRGLYDQIDRQIKSVTKLVNTDYKDVLMRHPEIIVLSDELYCELNYLDGKPASLTQFAELRDRVVMVNGFSKSYAMTGFRVGYLAGPHELIAPMVKIHQYCIMCAPSTSQLAVIEAAMNSDDEVKKMRDEYNHRRRVIVQGLRDAGLECFTPYGAFYAFPCIKSTGLTSEEFCEKLLIVIVELFRSGCRNMSCTYS